MLRRTLIFASVLSAALAAQEVSQSGLRLEAARPMVAQPVRAPQAMAATVHELATAAALDILRAGGNAVDAAVAVGFVLGVVHPEAGNLGGSGYLLLRTAGGRVTAIDYGGAAPTGSRPGMFASAREASVGYKSVAVPGTVSGLGVAHAAYGKLKWARCLEPARRLAQNGFPASYRLELILRLQVPVMKEFPESAKIFLHGGDLPLKQNEILRQPELAATIGRIQKHGWREFYQGETARRIAADMAGHGGLLTFEDLRAYQANETEPLRVVYRGHPVYTMPPSATGGIALAVMLNVFGRYPMELGREGSAMVRHLQIEAIRRGHAARARLLSGEPVPIERLVSAEYAAAAADISLDRATPVHGSTGDEAPDTTQFTIADAQGNLVSNTYTLSGFFGSQVVARGTGVLLNNHMSAFRSSKLLAPGKRYPSTMAPTIVLRPDNSPYFALGTPGASTIPATLFQVISNIIDFRMSLRDAIEFPRLDASSPAVTAEPAALIFDIAERLRAMGHRISPQLRSQGDVQAILIEENTGWRVGASDGRRGGAVRGY